MADDTLEDQVADDERLYRSVRPLFVTRDAEGNVRLSSQAFADRAMRPSVDRAHLRDFVPERTRFTQADGVVSVLAAAVRSLRATRSDAKGNPVREYAADVEPVPLSDNPAHAEVYGRPGFDNEKVFRRICEALAHIARWEILPEGLRPSAPGSGVSGPTEAS